MDEAKTPTNETFARSAMALTSQQPLPQPYHDGHNPASPARLPQRTNSELLRRSRNVDSDGDQQTLNEENGGASEDETAEADGSRPSKKKRTQRFYCTDYPPCNLSFTRSEHLARHIRKHTGERPFQCHCSRRFSRLDNLRQHAQTVHVHEDIPVDSLAATGTRYQRQIRTERVRTNTGRARAATAGSLTPMRGHSKSLSTSSITSVGSVSSSVYSPQEDLRRRPPPLVMADPRDPRTRLAMDGQYRAAPEGLCRPPTPTEFSTPTSATFPAGQGSPHWGATMVSPSPSHSRSQSLYSNGGPRTPGRRLSVPSVNGLFQTPPNSNTGRVLFPGGTVNASNSGLYVQQNYPSGLASPTTSTASSYSRRESVSDEAWRRRTWHPDTRDFNGANNGTSNGSPSRLGTTLVPAQYQSPATTSAPIVEPAAQKVNMRLPGIESFDPLPPRRARSPPQRAPSPMAIDSEPNSAFHPPTAMPVEERRISGGQWDTSLHRDLTRLAIVSHSVTQENARSWANEASRAVLAQADQSVSSQQQQQPRPQSVRFEPEPSSVHQSSYGVSEQPASRYSRGHQHTTSAPVNNYTPRQAKRMGWYNGPVTVTNDVANPPRDYTAVVSNENASANSVDRIVHPNLADGFTGFPARVPQTVPEHQAQQQSTPQRQYIPPRQNEDMASDPLSRLDALVAVATSEASATAAAAY